jgi:hypothetical protein
VIDVADLSALDEMQRADRARSALRLLSGIPEDVLYDVASLVTSCNREQFMVMVLSRDGAPAPYAELILDAPVRASAKIVFLAAGRDGIGDLTQTAAAATVAREALEFILLNARGPQFDDRYRTAIRDLLSVFNASEEWVERAWLVIRAVITFAPYILEFFYGKAAASASSALAVPWTPWGAAYEWAFGK